MKIIAAIIYVFFRVVFLGMPLLFTIMKLAENITIIRKGKKFKGTCTRYISNRQCGGYEIHWKDGGNMNRCGRFRLPLVKLKYPFTVNIYSLHNSVNVGVFSVIRNVMWIAVCLFVWIIGIYGTADFIHDIILY